MNRRCRRKVTKNVESKQSKDSAESIAVQASVSNNKDRSTKVTKQAQSYCFTLNNYTQTDISDIILYCKKNDYKYCFQEEVGECGTPHLQGVIKSLKGRITFTNLQSTIPRGRLSSTRSVQKSLAYCSKLETREGKVYNNFPNLVIKEKPIDHFDVKKASKWQLDIIEEVKKEPDNRTIYWYWSNEGKVGKSILARHLVIKYNAICIGGKKEDIYYAFSSCENKPKICIIDVPRNTGNKISYTAIEKLKDGMFFSPKYESAMCVFNPPHIIIFANAPPERSSLSEDRLIITQLDNLIEEEENGRESVPLLVEFA